MTESACPICGGPITTWGCRRARLGDYCHANGLRFDPALMPPVPVDPVKEAVERSAKVRAAKRAHEAAERSREATDAKWEAAALAAWRARDARARLTQTIMTFGEVREIEPDGAKMADIRRLQAVADGLLEERTAAERRVHQLWTELEDTRARARRELRLQDAAR